MLIDIKMASLYIYLFYIVLIYIDEDDPADGALAGA